MIVIEEKRKEKLYRRNERLKEKVVTRQQAAHTATQSQFHTSHPETSMLQ